MNSAIQYNYDQTIRQELVNPDPRIRDARAALLGYATDAREMTLELMGISGAVMCDGLEPFPLLGEHTITLLEDAVYRIQSTVAFMSHGAIKEGLLHLCASCLHMIAGWLDVYAITPDWPQFPGRTNPAPSSPWYNPEPSSPTLQLSRPRAEIKTRVLSAMGGVQ